MVPWCMLCVSGIMELVALATAFLRVGWNYEIAGGRIHDSGEVVREMEAGASLLHHEWHSASACLRRSFLRAER